MLIFAHNRRKRFPYILTPVFCKSGLTDLYHIRLYNPISVFSRYSRHWLPNVDRSALSAVVALNDKRLWIVQNKFF